MTTPLESEVLRLTAENERLACVILSIRSIAQGNLYAHWYQEIVRICDKALGTPISPPEAPESSQTTT